MRKVRLFIEDVPFKSLGQEVPLTSKQAHYVQNVMRVTPDQKITIFNGFNGLWSAQATYPSKKTCLLILLAQLKKQPSEVELHLHFSPLKQSAQGFLIEKATELGVTHFHPILTERTVVRAFKTHKNRLSAIEASEQCDRLNVPKFIDLKPLDKSLSSLEENKNIIFVCDERLTALKLKESLGTEKIIHIVIGPEGGFSPTEFSYFERNPAVKFVTLNNNILRAETAALAALSIVSA